MATKIKLMRLGKMREPHYRIVVADARTKRDGRAIETIGEYHPKNDPSVIRVDGDRAAYWLGVGAQPTEAVAAILKVTGDWQKFKGEPAPAPMKVAEPKQDKQAVFNAALAEISGEFEAPATTPKKKAAPKAAAEAKAEEPAAEAPAETDVGTVQKASLEAKPVAPKPVDDTFVIKRILPIDGPIKYGEWHWDETNVPDGPIVITVDLDARVLSIFKGGYEIGASAVLLGTEEKPTPLGVFPITQKERHHVSNLYDAEMPYMQRLTDDGITLQILSVFPGFVLQQIQNCLAVRQVLPKGQDRTELNWTYIGYADDTPEQRNVRLKQLNLVGPAGFISMEDGAVGNFVQRGIAGADDQEAIVEMGGDGVASSEGRATETSVRGFWKAWRHHMGA